MEVGGAPLRALEWRDAGTFAEVLFHSSPVPGWITDLETMRFLDVNREAVNRYGYTRDSFLSSELLLLRPNDSLDVLSQDYNHFASRSEEWFERRHRTASGQWIPVSVRVQPILFDGRSAGMVVVQDYTAQFEMQERLDRAEQRYQSIMRHCPEATVIIDRNGCVTEWSGQAESMFGYSRDDILGKPMHEFIMPERYRERHRHGLSRYVATGAAKILGQVLDVPALRKSGEEIRAKLVIHRIAGVELEFVAYIRELSDEAEAER